MRLRRWAPVWATLAIQLTAGGASAAEPKVVNLWNGPPPGTERWTVPEVVQRNPAGAIVSYANVRDATLSIYLPDPAKANGAAVVILPGGGLRVLSWDAPVKTAEWLNRHGVAAFILKYRTLQTPPGPRPAGPPPPLPANLVIRNGNANPAPGDKALDEVLRMGVADAQAAMRYVRGHAANWKIDGHRVGMLGFSAGGGVVIGAALAGKSDASPDFLVSLYGPSLVDVNVPEHAPPLFIAVGADHQPVANGLIALHAIWKAAGKSSELHIYDLVKGPFGFSGAGGPVDGWPDRLLEWMTPHGLLNASPPPGR